MQRDEPLLHGGEPMPATSQTDLAGSICHEESRSSRVPANDNAAVEAEKRVDRVVLKLARLVARQIAREQFDKRSMEAANDDIPS